MNCLVTGGCGFIGRHLVKALVGLKHRVVVCDIDRAGFARLPISSEDCYQHDVAEWGSYEYMFGGRRFDVVFHLAAVSRTVPAMEDPVRCYRTNVLGTAKVLEYVRWTDVKRAVVSSSNVVYAGATPYRDSKRALEEVCSTYAELYKQPVIALRYSNVYGPGIPKGDPAVFAMLRDSFQTKGYAEVTGDGGQTRDFTHVSDIVRGNLAAWTGGGNCVVDLCTGRQTSINRACELLVIPAKYVAERPGDIKAMVQDSEPAKRLLGWEPTVELETGINDVWSL